MLWEKMNKHRFLILSVVFVLLFVLTHAFRLNTDEINPDGVNWHERSQQFVVGLKNKDFERTYQHYHPGVTLMWVTGIPVEIYKQITGIRTYTHTNFLEFHLVAKASLMLYQLGLFIIIFYLLSQLFGTTKSFFAVLVLSIEPFFLGNSRLYHLDIILSLQIFISFLGMFLSYKHNSKKYAILSGIFFSLAFLSKSIAVIALPFIGAFCLYEIIRNKNSFRPLVLFTASFLIFTLLAFPALWTDPIKILQDIFNESERVGIRNGHSQILFGDYTESAGLEFYPLVLALKLSPFLIAGLFLSGATKKDKHFAVLALFSIFYFFLMSYPNKKLDRYMLPIFPFLSLMSVFGYYDFFVKSARKFKVWILTCYSVLFTVFIIIPLYSYFPFYFTYTSPTFVSPKNANKIIAQKPFGIGIFDLKNLLEEKYGSPDVGFIDTKPIKEIYPNSKVSDIRINGTSDYDVIVLGVNEEMPEKVLKSDTKFVHDTSLYINGLEYWKVYVKEDK